MSSAADRGVGQAGTKQARRRRWRWRGMVALYATIIVAFAGCFALDAFDLRMASLFGQPAVPEPAVVPAPLGTEVVSAETLLVPPTGLRAEPAPESVAAAFRERFADLGPFADEVHRTYFEDAVPVAGISLVRVATGGDGEALRERAAGVLSLDADTLEAVTIGGRDVVAASTDAATTYLWAPDPRTVVIVVADDPDRAAALAAVVLERVRPRSRSG